MTRMMVTHAMNLQTVSVTCERKMTQIQAKDVHDMLQHSTCPQQHGPNEPCESTMDCPAIQFPNMDLLLNLVVEDRQHSLRSLDKFVRLEVAVTLTLLSLAGIHTHIRI